MFAEVLEYLRTHIIKTDGSNVWCEECGQSHVSARTIKHLPTCQYPGLVERIKKATR